MPAAIHDLTRDKITYAYQLIRKPEILMIEKA